MHIRVARAVCVIFFTANLTWLLCKGWDSADLITTRHSSSSATIHLFDFHRDSISHRSKKISIFAVFVLITVDDDEVDNLIRITRRIISPAKQRSKDYFFFSFFSIKTSWLDFAQFLHKKIWFYFADWIWQFLCSFECAGSQKENDKKRSSTKALSGPCRCCLFYLSSSPPFPAF